jgi:hypothetical protein
MLMWLLPHSGHMGTSGRRETVQQHTQEDGPDVVRRQVVFVCVLLTERTQAEAAVAVPSKITSVRLNLFRKVAQAESGGGGGREHDILITTDVAIFLMEAKWTGQVASGQGKNGDLDQIALDRLYAQWVLRHLPALVEDAASYAVVLVGIHLENRPAFTDHRDTPPVYERSITWEELCSNKCPHPDIEGVREYFDWRLDFMNT